MRGYLESLGKDMKPNGQQYNLWIYILHSKGSDSSDFKLHD